MYAPACSTRKEMNEKKTAAFSFLLITLLMFLACTPDISRQLMAEDFHKMNNEELLRYFYRVNDEIERLDRQSVGSGVGVGIGTFGHGGGFGVGYGAPAYDSTAADDLKKRRIDVRLELKKRGLSP
jgi:hypothetical protein